MQEGIYDNSGDALAEIDWSSIIKNRILTLHVDYVLVLEWLPEVDAQGRKEEHTGERTAIWLREKFGPGKVAFRRCECVADVQERLAQAKREVGTRGVPVVHIEAHGGADGFLGPDGAASLVKLTWAALGEWLRPLNVATRFNLLLVGAGCFGEGLMLAVEGGQPMPFTAVVGYTDGVNPGSLKESMVELYRQLFVEHSELGLAVEEADRQHRYDTDAVLRPTLMTILALESFIDMARDRIGVDRREDHALDIAVKAMRANGYDLSLLPYSTIKVSSDAMMLDTIKAAWATYWMTGQFPENAERFAVDFDCVLAVASRLRGTVRTSR